MRIRYQISDKWGSKAIMTVIDALDFAIDFLDIEEEKSTLNVKLLTGHKSDQEDATADRLKSKRYEIRLSKASLDNEEEMLKAIFHEMVHVRQFAENGLRLYARKKALYEGKEFIDFDYWFAPWEMEARAMEEPMYRLFMEEH